LLVQEAGARSNVLPHIGRCARDQLRKNRAICQLAKRSASPKRGGVRDLRDRQFKSRAVRVWGAPHFARMAATERMPPDVMCAYLHGPIDRTEAEAHLTRFADQDGWFLVRRKDGSRNTLVLSVVVAPRVEHHIITLPGYTIGPFTGGQDDTSSRTCTATPAVGLATVLAILRACISARCVRCRTGTLFGGHLRPRLWTLHAQDTFKLSACSVNHSLTQSLACITTLTLTHARTGPHSCLYELIQLMRVPR
jgi:hypothetical protein